MKCFTSIRGIAAMLPAVLILGCLGPQSPIALPAPEVSADIPQLGLETPYPGVVRGLVVANLAYAAESGFMRYAFMLSAPKTRADRDPDTPDAILVRIKHGRKLTYRDKPYYPAPGDELIIRGEISEDRGSPVLESPELIRIVRTRANLDAEAPAMALRIPEAASEAAAYWRSHLGRRCIVPAGSEVQGYHETRWKRIASSATLLRPNHPLLKRLSPFERRTFRDEHPLDDRPDELFDNLNGFLFTIGDSALRHQAGSKPITYIPHARTFDVVAEDVLGVITRDEYDYVIELLEPVRFTPGKDPAINKPRRVSAKDHHLSVATYNLENLYDHSNDPFDSRDYQVSGTARVHNYVPRTEQDYKDRLQCIAHQIIDDLRQPDIIVIQEIEDQDIGYVDGTTMVHTTANNRDELPDALQDLALTISANGGTDYVPACDRSGADSRGITSAYLYRPDRVALAGKGVADEILTGIPSLTFTGSTLVASMALENPRAINGFLPEFGMLFDRPPQVAVFVPVAKAFKRKAPVFVMNNHFRSRPDKYVDLRRAQAAFNAALFSYASDHHKDAAVIVAGDLNTFPRPCEPVRDEPADQLGPLYNAGLANLYDQQIETHPTSAYSYVYKGQAQTIDHIFVSPALKTRLAQVIPLHINSDFAPFPAYRNRGCSDHDPQLAVFDFGK